MHPVQAAPRQSGQSARQPRGYGRCTPCRQRRGKGSAVRTRCASSPDAPRAGSAEAKPRDVEVVADIGRCTPCRQRRGKGSGNPYPKQEELMHPVQAAPRQRSACRRSDRRAGDAPRAGSAEAKFPSLPPKLCASRCTPCRQRRGKETFLCHDRRGGV